MGNQQERSLAWLAGILDGEGTVSVQVYTMPDGRVRLTPFVSLVNSDEGILTEVRDILDRIGVKYRNCGKPISGGPKSFEGRKPVSNIRMDGAKPCRMFLEIILPYLRSDKKRNAETVLKYLDSREKWGLQRNEKGHIRRVEYSRDEIELISSIRSHSKAKSSEAICQAPNVTG